MTTVCKLKKNYEFKKVYNEGRYYVEKYVVMYIIMNNSASNRVGFSVSKKVGNSVIRNRVKRLIKEVYRQYSGNTKMGYDIVFTARVGSAEADYKKIESNIVSIIRKAKLKKNEE
jgi:ribonuclease P protein component